MGCKVKVPRLFVLDTPAFCCCASLQNATSDMYITVDGDVSVVGTGSEPVYCTGPFAGNNVHLSSNTGKMLYISSSIIVMYDLTVGSDGGAPVTIKNIVEVGVDAGNPLNLWVLLHKLHKSTHYRLTRPNHLTLALSLPHRLAATPLGTTPMATPRSQCLQCLATGWTSEQRVRVVGCPSGVGCAMSVVL